MSWWNWLVGILLDNVPWWAWVTLVIGAAAATVNLWLPLYMAAPGWVKVSLWLVGVGAIGYVAGRNKGSEGALQRAREKEQRNAENIRKVAAEARSRSERDSMGDGLRRDDGFKRPD